MANQPTIVVANLDDTELKKSIDKMVKNLDEQLLNMMLSTDTAVKYMQKSLQSVGNIKFGNINGDGGSARRTKKQQEEADIVTKTAKAYDQLSASMQKTTSSSKNESPTQTMQTQLELMIERLRSARSQYSSFIELAAHATTTGDKGLFQFATENVHRYEQEIHDIIPQIRNLRDAISQMGNVLAPQGHAIENFAKSLQQTNPELALLNQQYKRGVALLQQQNIGLKRTADEERTIAEESRNRLQKESQYVAAASQREKQRREDITQSAQAARELSRELIKGLSSGNIEINYQNYAKLKEYFEQMRQVYHNFMTEEEKESPVGKALKSDINVVGAAIRVLKEYSSAFNRFQHEAPKPSGIGNNQSLDSLKNAIKNLSDAYSRMTVEEMRAGKDTKIIEKFQRLNREAQVLQRRLSTPVSLSSAMKLPERTLDEIAYKMQMLARYRLNLNIFDPKEKAEIDAVNKALDRLGKEQNKILGNNKEMLASNNALIRSFNYMKNRLAFYFTVGASTQFVKSLIDIRSQYEMNERALGILINSAERGTQIFKELSEMALVSPYTLIELSSAAKQLVAYDIAAKDVVDTTRRLADMASAVGVPMERLTYALGQIKAYGYLNSRDARMFANAGIPLVKQLADYYTQLEGRIISVGDVYDRMKKKTIDYNDVMAVVTKMTDEGGKFFDFQAKMADSLKVRLANLTLAWNNMMNEIGESRQGMLTATIGGLKELFLHWKEIFNVVNGLVLAFGMFKLAQITALAFMGELNTAMGWQVILGTKLQQKLASLATGYKTMSMGITAAGAAFWIIAADAIMTYNKNIEEIERLNSTIQNGAAEASEALDKLLHSSEMVTAKLSAANNKLSVNEATKTWEVLREQIEMSASSSKAIVAELIKEEDLNIRVSKAFTLAESIQEATSRLSDLNNALDITQDSILWGAFGEGLVEDIEDYNEHLKQQAEITEWVGKKNKSFFDNAATGIKYLIDSVREDFGSSSEEAETEIRNFAHNAAETIREELGEQSLKDDIQVNEAVARVLSGIEQMFPQIRGKGKALFEEIFYDIMSKEFSGAVDKQAFYYDKFLERLKKDHASAFSDVTNDILKGTHTWSTAQTDAIQKTADKLKKDMPEAAQSAIDDILSKLNSTEFKARIVMELATSSLDNIQKSFKDKFITKDSFGNELSEKQRLENQQKYGALMRKNGEDNIEYEKRISEEKEKQQKIIDKNEEIIKKNANAQVVADAKVAKSNAEAFIAAAKDVEKWGGYDFSSKKENANAKKAAKQAESELQKALKDELSTIDKVRSIYKDLTKEGMSHADAVERATRGWDETVNAINRVLQKNGLQKLDLSKFAGIENPRELVNMLQSQLNTLLKRGAKPAEIKELQTKINTLWVDVDKYDLTMITKGLNNELGKLKDEYELALELDANPELGDMFAEMFNIDTSELPHTFGQALARVQESVNKALRGINVNDSFDILNGDIKAFASTTKLALEGDVVKSMEKAQKYVRDLWKKNTEETIKNWNTLLEKYGDYQTKLIKAVQDTAKEQLDIVRKFGNSEEQAEAINLSKKITVASDLDDVNRIQEQLKVLVDKVVKGKDVGIKLAASVEKSNAKTRAKIEWDTFKDSDYYAIMFEDMDRVSTRAIRSILEQLDVLKAKVKEDPASMKALMDAYKKGRDELESRAPFENIITSLKEWRAASIEVKDANVELTEANKELESAQANLANAQAAAANPNSRFSNDAEKAERLAKAQERYTKAVKNKQTAEAKVAQAEIRQISAQTKFQNALNGSATALQNVGGLLTQFAELLGITEDSEAGEMVKSLVQGFNLMATALTLVAAAAALAQMSLGWVAAVAAGLSVVVGLVSFLAGSSNRKITAQIEEIERDVHGLEIAYKNLEQAADDAYGAMVSGAKAALIANKQAQLDDLERQYELAKSRTGKHYDQDEVDKYHDAIVDLRNEIHELTQDITNELLDISSAGDGITSLVEVMIDAFKNGEDAMEAFGKKWDEMIDNMILKLIVSTFMQKAWDDVMRTLKDKEAEFMQKAADERAEAQKQYDQVRDMSDDEVAKMIANQLGYEGLLSGKKDEVKNAMQRGSLHSRGNANSGYYFYIDAWQQVTDEEIAAFRKMLESAVNNTEGSIDKASTEYTQWALDYMSGEGRDYMTNYAEMLKAALGEWYTYGQDSQKNLSALQQGLQGMSESTANSLEAYANSISQQVYLHSDLLTQIRDIIVGFDLDIQLDTLGQILLQLRSSYEIQSAIHSLLSGWSSDNERAVRVELLS